MPRTRVEERILIDPQTRSDVYHACGCRCAHCGKHLNYRTEFTIEHVVPLNKGGTNQKKNLVALCQDCNKTKSDDIIRPADYYPHLPKQKAEEVTAVFEEYIQSVDFLDKNNLFELDRFDLKSNTAVLLKNHKFVFAPTTLHVEKLRKEAAFDWLYYYTGRLSPGDKTIMAQTPDDLTDNIYKCEQDGKILFLFSAEIEKAPDWDNPGQLRDLNVLTISLYINPELKFIQNRTIQTLHQHLNSIINKIQQKFIKVAPGSTIECLVQSPHSDTTAALLYDYLYDTKASVSHRFKAFAKGVTSAEDGYGHGITMTLFNGDKKLLLQTANEHGYKSPADMTRELGPEQFATPLNDALERIQEQVPEKPVWRQPAKKKKSAKKHKKHKK